MKNTPRPPRRSGFSLVEVTIATGIAAMSILVLFGLLPSGLNVFRETMNMSVSSQIAQRLLHEAVQTDYDMLVQGSTSGSIRKPWRYFDDQGVEVTVPSDAIYHVLTRIGPSTSLPNSAANPSLATVTVQVAVNPSNQNIPVSSASGSGALENTITPSATVSFRTYTGHIAKIK